MRSVALIGLLIGLTAANPSQAASTAYPSTPKEWKKFSCKMIAELGMSPRLVTKEEPVQPAGPPITSLLVDLDDTLIPTDRSLKLALRFIGRLWTRIRVEHLDRTSGPVGASFASTRTMITIAKILLASHPTKTIEQQILDFLMVRFQIASQDAARELLFGTVSHAYDVVRPTFGTIPGASELVEWLKSQGYPMVLATTPMWPEALVTERAQAGAINAEDFLGVTTMDRHNAGKPHERYFDEVHSQYQLDPTHSLFIGNDLKKDCVPSLKKGTSAFLVILDAPQMIEIQARTDTTPGFWAGNYEHLKSLLDRGRF